ncbi:MAG: DUF4381 domain-containing protein [Methylococcales bacterium]|nr:DUF4381 domain-containing protein [Methylococcales bacterium]
MKDLRDIHLPEEINVLYFPIGWWFLFILMIIFLYFCVWVYKKTTQKTVLKTAKNNLLKLKHDKQLTSHQKIKQLSTMIRHVIMSANLRTDCASLTGEAWLNYIDTLGGKKVFNSPTGRLLILAPYQKEFSSEANIDHLILLTEEWLKTQS